MANAILIFLFTPLMTMLAQTLQDVTLQYHISWGQIFKWDSTHPYKTAEFSGLWETGIKGYTLSKQTCSFNSHLTAGSCSCEDKEDPADLQIHILWLSVTPCQPTSTKLCSLPAPSSAAYTLYGLHSHTPGLVNCCRALKALIFGEPPKLAQNECTVPPENSWPRTGVLPPTPTWISCKEPLRTSVSKFWPFPGLFYVGVSHSLPFMYFF